MIDKILYMFEHLNGVYDIIEKVKVIISVLSKDIGDRSLCERNYQNHISAKNYIFDCFRKIGADPNEEKFTVNNLETSNIVAEIRGRDFPDNIIIIGAHYDTVEDSAGANDNATGIAALMEIYRLLHGHKIKRTVRFVAFSTEEPPYFATDDMGSSFHARKCLKKKENIDLMIAIDMIGYGGILVKQQFPLEGMKGKYPSMGTFLATVTVPSSTNYAYLWKNLYNTHSSSKTYDIIAPASVNGINLSDHYSFTKLGIPAIMITDTGFYRNNHYHTENDTYDKVNFRFLGYNILSIYKTIKDLANLKKFV